jgi:hypothetical protein
VARKLVFLGKQACLAQAIYLSERAENPEQRVVALEFDEVETLEHSKMLPLSIALAVEAKTRKILGFSVARMPAKGLLAEKSRKKYGWRKDERAAQAKPLLKSLGPLLAEGAEITTDENPHYPGWLKASLPGVLHKTTPGKRGCVTAQGELKKVGFDPIFSLNHTAAMLRANINRLFRKTWCTTKRPDRLAAHLAIYVQYHNEVLTAGAP